MPRSIAPLLVILLAIPLSGERARAQAEPPARVDIVDDLPSRDLRCVYADDYGFSWFCSDIGLIRFDGRRSIRFGTRAGLRSPSVHTMLRDSTGRYWVGADDGIYEFIATVLPDGGRRFDPVRRRDGRPVGTVTAIIEGHDRSLWSGSTNGLVHFSPNSDDALEEVDIGLPAEGAGRAVKAVVQDERLDIWAGTVDGLYRRTRDGQTQRFTTRDGLPGDEVLALARSGNGPLLVGTRRGLAVIDRQALTQGRSSAVRVLTVADGLPSNVITSLRFDDRALWIGTDKGALLTAPPYDQLHTLAVVPGPPVTAISRDAHDGVWVVGDGARRVPRQHFADLKEFGDRGVAAFFEARDDGVCAITAERRPRLRCAQTAMNAGARVIMSEVDALAAAPEQRRTGWSRLTRQDGQGRWIVPTSAGVLQFPAVRATALATASPEARYTSAEGLPTGDVVSMALAQDAVWLATSASAGHGLVRLDTERRTLERFDERHGLPSPLPRVLGMIETRRRQMFVALEGGRFLLFNDGRFREVSLQPGAASGDVRAIARGNFGFGWVWMATSDSGLGRIEAIPAEGPMRVHWYRAPEHLFDGGDVVLQEIAPGAWLIGGGGRLFRFDEDVGTFTPFSIGAHTVPPVSTVLLDGRRNTWLGGPRDALVYRDAPLRAPPVVVTAVRVDGVLQPARADGSIDVRNIQVQSGARSLEVEWITPMAEPVETIHFVDTLVRLGASTTPYKVPADFYQNWARTDVPVNIVQNVSSFESAPPRGSAGPHRKVIDLTDSRPGTYLLTLQSQLSNQTGPPVRLEYTLLPPFWQRFWYIGPVLLGVGGILYGIRMRQLATVAKMRANIAADLHDRVGGNLSRIAIMTEVLRQQASVGSPGAMQALQSIGDNARGVLDDMSDAIWLIDGQRETLHDLVVRIRTAAAALFDGTRTTWAVNGPANARDIRLTDKQRRHLYLAAKEALTNVYRHAVAGRVDVRLDVRGATLHLEVQDDGVGSDTRREQRQTGRGIASMRDRAANLKGEMAIETKPNAGTRVVLTAPLRV